MSHILFDSRGPTEPAEELTAIPASQIPYLH